MTVLAEGMAGSRPRTPAGRAVAALNRTAIHVFLALIGLIWLVPTLGLLVTSFRPRADIQSTGWWDIFNLHLTLDNYRQVLEAQGMLQAFLNTVFIAVPSTLLPLVICAMAAYAFSWMRFPFRDSLFLIVVGLLMIPVQVAFIPVLTGMRELLPWADHVQLRQARKGEVQVHADDGGDVDFGAVLQRLDDLGYRGLLSVEYFDLPDMGWPLDDPVSWACALADHVRPLLT